MNIALSAVIIFILLIPPIAFYVSYSFGSFSRPAPKFTLLDGLLASAIFSLFIHAVSIFIIQRTMGGEIRLDILLKMLGGELKDLENKLSNRQLAESFKQFALYNVIILAIAVLLGRSLRLIIIRTDFHWRKPLFRLHNNWWYLFNGYQSWGQADEFDLVYADAVVDTVDGTMIYSGYLLDYVCDGETLDRIYLESAVRREFKKTEAAAGDAVITRNEPGEPFTIPGNIFSVAYAQIKNLNLQFITLDATEEEIDQLPQTEPFDPGINVVITPVGPPGTTTIYRT